MLLKWLSLLGTKALPGKKISIRGKVSMFLFDYNFPKVSMFLFDYNFPITNLQNYKTYQNTIC